MSAEPELVAPVCSAPADGAPCGEYAENTVRQVVAVTGRVLLVHRCRAHTTRWDHLLIGPGPG